MPTKRREAITLDKEVVDGINAIEYPDGDDDYNSNSYTSAISFMELAIINDY